MSAESQRLNSLQKKAVEWDDQVLQKHLNFYQIVKKGFQPVAPNEIIAVFNSARKYFEKRSDDRYTGVCHYYIGSQCYKKKQYGEAFYHHAKVLELFDGVGIQNVPEIGKYLHVIAINHFYFHNYRKVVQLMLAAIRQPAYNTNLDVQRYNTLAMAYQKLNKLDSAIFYFTRTRDVAISLGNTTWPHLAIGNMGRVYFKQGRYHEAVNLLMRDYQHSQYRERHPVLARNAAVEIAATWQKLSRQDSILHYLRESGRLNAAVRNGEPMWKQQRDEEFYLTYYQVFHDYFKTGGNMPMAYRYLDSLTHLSNETNLRYNRMTAQVAEDSLRIQQYLADKVTQQTEKKKMSVRLQFVIGVVGNDYGLALLFTEAKAR